MWRRRNHCAGPSSRPQDGHAASRMTTVVVTALGVPVVDEAISSALPGNGLIALLAVWVKRSGMAISERPDATRQ